MLSSRLIASTLRVGVSSQSRSICHKSKLKPKANNYQWPHERRSWGCFNFWMDRDTKGKFDENTKIIQVEGNISSGKEEFAKQLAEELGMLYLPQPDLDSYFINDHGFDYRALNPMLPERMRACDWEMFHECPSRHSVIHMQFYLFRLRFATYLRALRHLFNTGQGIVMTRTVWTERAIVEAMHNVGWLPTGHLRDDGVRFYDWKQRYMYIRNMSLTNLQRPHLCIYLDTPVDICLERLERDPDPMIANSKAHSRQFLEEIESSFKDSVLAKQEHNMHVLVLPHEEPKTRDEILDIIDDIEPLHFEYDPHDTRFTEWCDNIDAHYYFTQRRYYTTRLAWNHMDLRLQAPWFDIAGLGDSITQGDIMLRQTLYEANVKCGLYREFDTDPQVHGIFRQIFGTYLNLGRRCEKFERVDFV